MQEAKNTIINAKSIYLIPGESAEAISCTLALFYTLKESGKNVNLVLEDLPESLKFLSPSLDFISYPKNFVFSIPESVAKISQIYYEKNPDNFKIHLTLDSGVIKKDNVSFYFTELKPDLIITIGVQDYIKALSERLDQYAFLLDSPILNIDNSPANKNFGKINVIAEKSLAELILQIQEKNNKESAKCLMTSLVDYTNNFKKGLTAQIFQIASDLIKQGADLNEINNNFYGRE